MCYCVVIKKNRVVKKIKIREMGNVEESNVNEDFYG